MAFQLALSRLHISHKAELTARVIQERIEHAYEVKPNWDRMAPECVKQVIDTYAKSIGVPKELILCPLLTAAAGQFHPESGIELVPNSWMEPPILWTILVGKGEKMSAVQRLLVDALKEVQGIGFMQPTEAIAMLNDECWNAWNDRHPLLVCPEPVAVEAYEDLVAKPNNTMCLGQILHQIRQANSQPKKYTLTQSAKKTFQMFHDEAVGNINGVAKDNDAYRGVYSEARGQVARVALLCHGLYNAIKHQTNTQSHHVAEDNAGDMSLDTQITNDHMQYAVSIVRYGMAHKFALMPPLATI